MRRLRWTIRILGGPHGRTAQLQVLGPDCVVIFPPLLLPNMAMTERQTRVLAARLLRAADACHRTPR